MRAILGSPLFMIGVMFALAALYVLPTVIALLRRVERIWVIVILNLFTALWPAAMFGALVFPRRDRVRTYVVPTSPYDPGRAPRTVIWHGP